MKELRHFASELAIVDIIIVLQINYVAGEEWKYVSVCVRIAVYFLTSWKKADVYLRTENLSGIREIN